jgi:hypothetical protein
MGAVPFLAVEGVGDVDGMAQRHTSEGGESSPGKTWENRENRSRRKRVLIGGR